MNSRSAELTGLVGSQLPRVTSVPPCASSAGAEAVDLARLSGLVLDPWEELVLAQSLGERVDGRWAAFEVGVVVARQNGKGAILEARELAGLFLLGERMLIHSAHQFDTSLEAFRRLLALIEDTPDFDRRVHKVSRSHGEEGIELRNRQRIRFRTRTKGGGRGFTSDCLILDEAMDLPETAHGALLPTLSARPNPQVWYTGSAVDQESHEHGMVLARIRERGMRGDDPSLAYFEWSVDPVRFEANPSLASDPLAWAEANPGLGIRISLNHIANEQRSMDPRTFAVERLSVGDWPSTDGEGGRVINAELWAACADPGSQLAGQIVFALDVSPDRKWGAVAVAGARADGRWHVEVVDHRAGTGWMVARAVELNVANPKVKFVIDPRSPAASLMTELADADIDLIEVSAQDYARACGGLVDAVTEQRVMYPAPQPELDAALASADTRPLGDAWAWSRRSSHADVSSLVAGTLAVWAAQNAPPPPKPRVINLNDAGLLQRLRNGA